MIGINGTGKQAMINGGRTAEVCQQRQAVLTAAYEQHPERFKNGQPTAKPEPAVVWINRPADSGTAATTLDANRQ